MLTPQSTAQTQWIARLLVSLCLLLSHCGGGNSVTGIDGSGAPATASNPTIATGTVSGFGSVIVNGVHFSSDKASIQINGQSGTEDDLRAGHQVTIVGEIKTDGTAIANSIEYYPDVAERITAIDSLHKSLTIGGLTILTNPNTLYDAAISPNYFDSLKIGDSILVSGTRDEKNNLVATRISYGNSQSVLLGSLSAIDTSQTQLIIDGIKINYAGAKLNGVTTNTFTLGTTLRVKGTTANKVLNAAEITLINQVFDKNLKSASVEGRINRFISATDYAVNGLPCTTNSATNFNGAKASDLHLGASIRAKGTVTSDGKLLAESIWIEMDSDSEIAGEVTQISAIGTTSGITTGTLVINGVNIQTTISTTYEDRGPSNIKRFNFTSIIKGDFLIISGFTKDNIFYASKIERSQVETNKELELDFRGIFIAIDQHSFNLLGRTVVTNNKTEFKNAKGEEISEQAFYIAAAGKLVEVKGILIGGVFTASEVGISPPEDD